MSGIDVIWRQGPGQCSISLEGALTLIEADAAWTALGTHTPESNRIAINCGRLTALDSAGIAVLAAFARTQKKHGRTVALDSLHDKHAELIEVFGWDTILHPVHAAVAQSRKAGRMDELRAARQHLYDLATFAGRTIAGVVDVLVRPSALCWREVVNSLRLAGPGAVPVVCTISCLVGFVVALQAKPQLESLGMEIRIAQLVGFALFRELAPIMTSVIMAGRTGSAYAAELGSMRISEELDAMEVMVLNPYRYLIAPKMIAMLIAFPCLTMFADLAGLMGGVAVGSFCMDIPVHVFLKQTFDHMRFFDLGMGLYKSVVFGILVAGVGCFRGIQVSMGADSVGRATTSAAVSGIFLTIVADALITLSGYLI